MKTSRFIISILFASVVLLAQAGAQTGTIRVNVAFNFTVAHQTMPAGDYLMSVNGSLLRVANIDGSATAHAMTVYSGGGAAEDATPRLVFHQYGDRHFLSEVWIGLINQGYQLYASADEVQSARTTKQEVVP
jgi:hypothetical protein